MKGKTVALVVLAFGGLYLLWKYGRSTGSPLLSDLDPIFDSIDPGVSYRPASASQAAVLPYQKTTMAGNVYPQTGPYASPAFPIGAVGTAGTTAALGGTAAVSAAAVATAGIAAGVGILAWGITSKGWFRGGEEGIKVNPARDAFLAQFAKYDYITDAANPPGFYGLSLILTRLNAHDLFDQLAHAQTMDAFTRATTAIEARLSSATPAEFQLVMSDLAYYRGAA
jgi:hypothetical protein